MAPLKRYCGLGNHILKTPNTRIKDPKMLHFALNINPELRHDSPLCMSCFVTLEKIYKLKLRNAAEHRARKLAESVTDVSSSQRQDITSSSDPSSTTSSSTTRRLATATAAAAKPPTAVPVYATTSEDSMPTTSMAAAQKRKRPNTPAPQVPESSENSDDDANSNLSLNAVNGTRLPHIQPIPKRRPVVHLNKAAMDIYLAGTTGG